VTVMTRQSLHIPARNSLYRVRKNLAMCRRGTPYDLAKLIRFGETPKGGKS
jgi:hypothetical protein